MDLDRILHDKKNFAELDDADIEAFLSSRAFGSEHLNLEFKSQFPQKSNHRYDVRDFCKYIVGFSNEEGGLIIYGVSDDIKSSAVMFPSLDSLMEIPGSDPSRYRAEGALDRCARLQHSGSAVRGLSPKVG